MLVIDCCIRGEKSATRKYYQAYLDLLPSKDDVEILYLDKLDLKPLTASELAKRDELIAQKKFDDKMFSLARQFMEADEILIAAPYWDCSFPSLLKVYLEHLCVSGLTFAYVNFKLVGYSKAKRVLYFSTCGGFVGERHLGAEYTAAVCAMLGIEKCMPFTIEGMDVDPAKHDDVLAAGIAKLKLI